MTYYNSIKTIFFITGLCLTTQLTLAQNDQVTLLAQSPDGRNVKLIWFVKKWNSAITGFDVKRKEGGQQWVKLNATPIAPGISMKRDFSALGCTRSEENMLKARLFKLLSSRKLRETDNTYLQKLNDSDKELGEIMQLILNDYDLALMFGFAFADHTVTHKTNYQYGLFIQGTDKLLAKVSWNYGQVPDLNVIGEITSKATTRNKGVSLIWSADLDKMNANDVAGFNIYRQGIPLNDAPIAPAGIKNVTGFSWTDRSADSRSPIQYSISAESIFGIEGIIRSYTYDPADHPAEYVSPEITDISSRGYYFKEGINVKWSFPKEYEHFIKGFYVEKENVPDGTKRVSDLIDPSARSFIDKTPSSVNRYIKMHIVALYNDHTTATGYDHLYSYFPISTPPGVYNLKGKVAADKKNVIHLQWDPKLKGDSITDHYRVYLYDADNIKFIPVDETHNSSAGYDFSIKKKTAGTYKFSVSGVSKVGVESPASSAVTVQTSTTELPVAVVTASLDTSGKAIIQWEYPEVSDLKGFRLFQNKNTVASETELGKDSREYTTSVLELNSNFEYTIRAVTGSGILSEFSAPVYINTTPK